MGIDDLVNQGKQFLDDNKDKIEEALRSDQAEQASDGVLDAAADFVKKVAPDSIDEKVDDILRAQKDAVLADVVGAHLVIEEAMTVREHMGRVSDVTWSKVQAAPATIASP